MAKRQLVAAHEAAEVPSQPLRPCADCPWARTALNGWLGSLTPHEWLAAAHSDALVDCHALKAPDEAHWQCAGIAVYRANVYKRPRDPEVMRGERDHVHVFSNPAEFIRHHEKSPKTGPSKARKKRS